MVYAAGAAVFSYVSKELLELLGIPHGENPVVYIPLGSVAFCLFIWAGWHSDFEPLIGKPGHRLRSASGWLVRHPSPHPQPSQRIQRKYPGHLDTLEFRDADLELPDSPPQRDANSFLRINFMGSLLSGGAWLVYAAWQKIPVGNEFLGIHKQGRGSPLIDIFIIEAVLAWAASARASESHRALRKWLLCAVGIAGISSVIAIIPSRSRLII